MGILHQPEGPQSCDVVFLHGIQRGDFKDAWWKSWCCEESGTYWPLDLLRAQVPQARILSVSYDAGALRTPTQGRMSIEEIGENLLATLVRSPEVSLGQNTPVIMIAHSLGGLVAMQLCNMVRCKYDR